MVGNHLTYLIIFAIQSASLGYAYVFVRWCTPVGVLEYDWEENQFGSDRSKQRKEHPRAVSVCGAYNISN